jgi:hypothetical protein
MKKGKKNNTKINTDYSPGIKKSREQLTKRDKFSLLKNEDDLHVYDNSCMSPSTNEELIVHDTNSLSNEEFSQHSHSNDYFVPRKETDYHDNRDNYNMHLNPYDENNNMHDNIDNQSINTLESSFIPHVNAANDTYSVSASDANKSRIFSNDTYSVNASDHSNVHVHNNLLNEHNHHDVDIGEHLNPHDMINNHQTSRQSNLQTEYPHKSSSVNSALNLTEQDIYRETTSQSIVMATMYNYDNVMDNVPFFEKNMNEINMSYNDLLKLFFSDAGGTFNSSIVNYIWTGINKFSLSSYLFEKYEETTGTSREQISPLSKILLYKESNIQKLSRIIKKTFSINLNEFNVACNSVVPRKDGTITAMIVLNLFFKSLNIYTRFNVKFQISCVPIELLGNYDQNDDNITFNFNELLVNN